MIKIFPHVLIRVSSGAFHKLETLNVSRTTILFKKILEEKQKKARLKQQLSEELYTFIPTLSDSKQQNLVLNLRRNIFNDRKVSPEKIGEVASLVSEKIHSDLTAYLELSEKIQSLEKEGETIFNEELNAIRENLKKLAQEDDSLQKGLILSSQTLLEQINHYLKYDSKALKKKELQIEQGLMKYITRMYAKTSPFSTFTNLAIGQIAANDGNSFFHTDGQTQPQVISHIRLNNYLFQYLKGLFFKNKEIYLNFLLRPNPTIRQEGELYVFLTNHNNIEAFQRIPFNPVLELLVSLCLENKNGIIYKDLIRTIIENEYIDASEEELQNYIQQLVEYGFLEYNIPVSGIDPDWDIKLCENLEPLAAQLPLIGELIVTLKEVRQLAKKFGEAKFEERKKLLEEAYNLFRETCMKLHEAAGLPAEERKTREQMMEEWKQKQKEEKEKKAKERQEKKEGKEENKEAEKIEEKPEEKKEEEEKEEEIAFRHQASTYFHFKPEQVFYEDTTIDVVPKMEEKELMEFIQPFHDLVQQMKTFEGFIYERDKMLHYFETKYDKEAKVNVLQFYEDYYRDLKKPELELQEKAKKEAWEKAKEISEKQNDTKNAKEEKKEEVRQEEKKQPEPTAAVEEKKEEVKQPGIIPRVKERQEKNKAWIEQFTGIIKEELNGNNEHLKFTAEHVRKAHRQYPVDNAENRKQNSYGMFVQFFTEKGENGNEKISGVINTSLPGFGKWLSRFLHIFEEKVTQDIISWNEGLGKEVILVENCDSSVFNANLHPTLMPYEVWMPGSQNALSTDKHIPITDMEVQKQGEELQLIHKPTGKRLFVFDLGFQGTKGRSQLFQLLSNFSLIEYLGWHPLTTAMNNLLTLNENTNKEKAGQEKKKIIFRPRILFQDNIIVQRKTWYVHKELLPLRQPAESDWNYFEKVNEWRISQEIPAEIFVFLADRQGMDNISPEERKRLGRDDYKPQYMNFNNPLLVLLFEKLLIKVPSLMRIEEMLPNSEQLLKLGSNRHITEFMVQWYES